MVSENSDQQQVKRLTTGVQGGAQGKALLGLLCDSPQQPKPLSCQNPFNHGGHGGARRTQRLHRGISRRLLTVNDPEENDATDGESAVHSDLDSQPDAGQWLVRLSAG